MKGLKKQLSLLDIFCVATGAMISSGLFILPGLAFAKAGPAVILSYILAGIFCIPALMSKAELTTAMPKAGGDYFYIMRGFGPLLGTMAGFSSWFSLSLKAAFALIGMGAYLSLMTAVPLKLLALSCCLFFIILNLTGIKEAARFQVFLVLGLLAILLAYVFWGLRAVNPLNFSPFFAKGIGSVFTTASFVFISYGGLTKIASLAEEVRNPGRNLPLAMFLSLILTSIFYALVIFVTVGVLKSETLSTTLIPISEGAGVFGGNIFKVVISVGAFFAFISTANSGIMSASRYPLGMSRDKLLSSIFQKISSKFKAPYISILFTGFFMLFAISFLKLELLVKIASSILILLYIFANLTLILFRESKILSYRPKFRSPFYPYLQILGILGGGFLLIEMGTFIVFLTTVFLLLAFIWYKVYVQKRASTDSALIYVLERLVSKDKELTSDSLLSELKDIVIERDEVVEDRFHKLIEQSKVLDIEKPLKAEDFFKEISVFLSKDVHAQSQDLFKKFSEREKESTTVIRDGLAIPHIIIEGKNIFKIVLVRAKAGIIFPEDKLAHIIFVLVASQDERNLHLKVLAAIAQITQSAEFDKKWLTASNEEELKNIILLAERRRG
ncbi:MAG: amino acid permease [Candidatus Omnitrophica bacterium]|nr:amino acid permease [Candidatus Omnitrophota bacterium]